MTAADRLRDALHRVDAWAAAPAVLERTGPLDPRAHPWTAEVAHALPVIRQELTDALDAGLPMPDTDDVAGSDQGGVGEWTTLVLSWFGRSVEANCARFPRTTEVLGGVPRLQGAGFTVLGPRSHIPLHRGPTHSYRYLLGVVVPEAGSCRFQVDGVECTWSSGQEIMFDDRTSHEAWNDGDERRYLLFVQTSLDVRGPRGPAHRATQALHGLTTQGIVRRAAGAASHPARSTPGAARR